MQPGFYLRILSSSVLLILSFPRPDIGFLSFLAFVPLFSALSGAGAKKAFLSGWGAGIAWFFVSYNWVTHSLTAFGGIPLPFAEALILLLAAVHGFYVGLFCALIPVVAGGKTDGMGVSEYQSIGDKPQRLTPLHRHSLAPLLVLPSAWVILEMIRSWFPAPFPWLLVGSTAWKAPFVGVLYEFAGVYGVSFWIMLVNVSIWKIVRTEGVGRLRAAVITVMLFCLPILLQPAKMKASGQDLRVGVVQGNFEQELKWEESLKEETLETYLSLTAEAVQRGAQVVVWPETAVPSFYQAEPAIMERLRKLSSLKDVHLIFGSPGYEIAGREILLYNRVYHLPPDGQEQFYDKIMLVPFGEYIPFSGLIPFVDRMVPGEGEFARGSWEGPFRTPVASGALICYEVSIPSLARREVRDGSSLLINVTNDAWFGRSWGPYQHLAVSAVRARENSVPVLRAANTGISAVIDRSGRIVKSIPLQERGVIVMDMETGSNLTLYTRFGDWIVFPSAAVLCVYGLLLLYRWRSRKWTI